MRASRTVSTKDMLCQAYSGAQGASLDAGCIFFDQRRRHAGRGYAYVAVSRFRAQAGCYLFGRLRMTDFLPVGEQQPAEVCERGHFSESDDSYGLGLELFSSASESCGEAGGMLVEGPSPSDDFGPAGGQHPTEVCEMGSSESVDSNELGMELAFGGSSWSESRGEAGGMLAVGPGPAPNADFVA